MSNLNFSCESKQLSKVIGFIDSIASMYSDKSTVATSQDNVLLESNEGKVYCIYAKQGIYIKVRLEANVINDGYIVVNPVYLSSLPSRAKDISISSEKDEEDNTIMKYKNGSSSGKLVVSDDKSSIEKQYISKKEIPSDSIKIETSELDKIVNKVLYTSSDPRIDKKLGLPITIKSRKEKVTVQSNDGFSAVIYKAKVKGMNDLSITTQGLLLQKCFSMFKDSVEFFNNETFTRLKGKKFDVIVTTNPYEKKDIVEWLKGQKEVNRAEIKTKDIVGLVSDVIVVSKLANIDPIVSFKFKNEKLAIANESTLGKSISCAKASYEKEGEYRLNANHFINLVSKIEKGDGVIITIYGQACVAMDKEEKITCILPLLQ